MLTLEHDGEERAFAEWGIARAGCICTRSNMTPDTYRFTVPLQDAAKAPSFAFLDRIIIRRNRVFNSTTETWDGGYIAFVGYCLEPTHDLSGRSERINFQFANAWYLLEQTPFQQPTAQNVGAGVGFQFQTGLVLFTKITEGHDVDPDEHPDQLPGFVLWITTGKQVREILDHALSQYALQFPSLPSLAVPFQIGTIDPQLSLPSFPAQELSCAAAIIKSLELSPEATVVWDYETDPPTIHVRNRLNFTPVSIALKGDHTALKITPLPTLQPSVVIIYFRITGSVDGETFVQFARQKYGPHGANSDEDPEGGLFALIQTIDLSGNAATTGQLTTRPVVARNAAVNDPQVAAVRAWWAKRKPDLASEKIREIDFGNTSITDENGAPVSLVNFPNELVDGASIETWMQLPNGEKVVGKRVTIKAEASYKEFNKAGSGTDGVTVKIVTAHQLSWVGTITNGVSGTYSAIASAGEEIPEGVAEALWTSLSPLQYQGEDVRLQAEIDGSLTMANTLNITGGRDEWATMKAQIQQITEDDSTGEISVSIGPPRHLSSGDLAALWRWGRNRRTDVNIGARANALP